VSKSALGNGIEALFGSIDDSGDNRDNENTISDHSIQELDIQKIIPADDQPRKIFNNESLQELADSIKEKGVIQPILVQPDGDVYKIVAGERRFRASKLAGLTELPVIVKTFSNEDRLEIALIENIQREDLTAIEEAEAYKQMIDSFSLSQDELAKKVGKKRSTIANSLRLLKLPDDMKSALQNTEISAGHCRSILSVINPADQRILFNRIITNQLSVREAEKQAGELNKGGRLGEPQVKETPKKVNNYEMQEIEQKFINIFGTKVQVKGSMKKGTIEISYFSKEDLERVYDLVTD
jgi:ParB family chromosome partitioning protein